MEYSYIAGLFDGEGCISILKLSRPKLTPNPIYSLNLSISSTYLPVLKEVQTFLGYGNIYYQAARGNNKAKGLFSVTGKFVRPFLDIVYPYLIIKRAEADVAYEFLETRVTGYSAKQSPEAIARRQALKEKLSALKGPTTTRGRKPIWPEVQP